jgi:mannose-6-phosphate isomerase-like protein (cupin superfamily)
MAHVLQLSDLIRPGQATRTARFEGADFDAGASFFVVDSDPGQRVGLHWHPYSETWIVLDGDVTFRLGDGLGEEEDTDVAEQTATAGAIVVVPARQHHGFTNTGAGALRMVCVHASPRMIQYDLED